MPYCTSWRWQTPATLTLPWMTSPVSASACLCLRFKTQRPLHDDRLIEIGGIQPLMKILLDKGLLHGYWFNLTGKTLAENLAYVKPYPEDQEVIHSLVYPIKKDSHLVVLYGNLAPGGAVQNHG